MLPFTTFIAIFVLHAVFAAPSDLSDVGLNTPEMIENHGYVAETHHVTTEDGYILTIHRIPHGIDDDGTTKKPIAFLMHGLTSSSSDWVNMGPEHSLGYILADLGYDVWMGNARGNAYSRNHTTLDIVADAEEFFDFSWHEIGYYDLPATIDYILDIKQDDSLYYVGHSQGTTTFLVLASTRPEYNDKIKIASLMAPAAILEHRPLDTLTGEFTKYIDKVEVILNRYKIYEYPFTEAIREWGATNCGDPDYYERCELVFSIVGGDIDDTQLDKDLIAVIATNAPSNAAMKQYYHFGQQVKNGGFSWYDYGVEKNLELYGSETPPSYDFAKISAPVAIYYAQYDGVVPYEDALTLISKLPNLANDYLVPYEPYNHLDFIFAKDNAELIYNELIAVMEKY